MRITLTAEVRPTEDPDRVRQAVLNIFPDAVTAETGDAMVMSTDNFERLSARIREQSIADTARALLLRSVRGNSVRFSLNKQAAFVGKVNFTDGNSVLGDIGVCIETDEPEAVARMIAEG